MGTLTFVVYLYFTRVIFTLLLAVFIKATKGKYYGEQLKKLFYFSVNGLFFNQIIRIAIEAYIEFFYIGVMNIYTAEYHLSGELLAIILTFFSHFMIFAVLPTLSLYVLCKNVEQLKRENFKNCIGEIYEGIKIESIY